MPIAYSLRAPPSAAQQRLRLPPPPQPFATPPLDAGAARRRRAVGVAAASASPFDELHARGRPVHGPSKVSQPPHPICLGRIAPAAYPPFPPKLNSSLVGTIGYR